MGPQTGSWCFHLVALLFVCRLLDFTHAVGSELVELDTCLLAEEPLQELHEEHGELPPEPPTLQQPVSMTSFSGVRTVPERHRNREKVGLSLKEAMKLEGGRGTWPSHALFLPSSSPAVPPVAEYPRALCLWRLGGRFLDLASCDKQPAGTR